MNIGEKYEYLHQIPEPEDYLKLRGICMPQRKQSPELARLALPKSVYAVIVKDVATDEIVGMGRVLGDGLFYLVTDIAVLPEHQGHGLGKGIVKRVTEFIEKNAMPGTYASLLADGEAHRLYSQFGFALTGDASRGMYRCF